MSNRYKRNEGVVSVTPKSLCTSINDLWLHPVSDLLRNYRTPLIYSFWYGNRTLNHTFINHSHGRTPKQAMVPPSEQKLSLKLWKFWGEAVNIFGVLRVCLDNEIRWDHPSKIKIGRETFRKKNLLVLNCIEGNQSMKPSIWQRHMATCCSI